jgi:hypothetical protein
VVVLRTEGAACDEGDGERFVPNYIALLEPHVAVEDGYVKLHAAMAKRGFFRQIQGDDVVQYPPPTVA